MTSLAERGQVVVPTEVRRTMNLNEGGRFVVMDSSDTIVLRRFEFS